MEALFTLETLGVLATLIFLQAVLGFDNLLYISIESKRAPADKQAQTRRMGIILAVVLRLVLLFVIMSVLDAFKAPLFGLRTGIVDGEFNLKAVIFLLGGAFIMYTALKEIMHMLAVHDLEHGAKQSPKSMAQVVTWIVVMNLVFSFDSILSMLPLTEFYTVGPDGTLIDGGYWPRFTVLAIAVLTSGAVMLLLADRVSAFLAKNRMYEVLGLFVLLIVGVLLLGEGGHVAHMKLAGYAVEPMSKATFYFSIIVLFIVEIAQTRYKRRLMAQAKAERGHHG